MLFWDNFSNTYKLRNKLNFIQVNKKKVRRNINYQSSRSDNYNNHLLTKPNKRIHNYHSVKIERMVIQRQYIKIPHYHRLVIFLATLVIILITLSINALWMQPLYKQGVNMIYSAQTNLNSFLLRIVNNLFSLLCHPMTVGLVLIFQMCVVKHKFKVLIHVSFFLLCIYFIAFLKQAYQQSRPIWSSKLIHKWEWFCPKDFGNPSGHSFALFPLYEPIISKYIGFQNFRFGWILLIVFGFLVPFSRTYLGVHSVNQVVFGLSLGVAATVLFRYGLRQMIYIIFSRIFKLKKLKYLVIAVLINLVCFILPFLFFQFYSQNRPMQQNDVENLNQFCFLSLSSLLIQQSMLVKCTLQSFIFGVVYGLYFLKNSRKDILYFTGRYQYVSNKAILYHFMSITLICGLIGSVFIVILPKIMQNTFIDYLSNTLGMILMGFSIVYILPKIQRTYNWIEYHDDRMLLLMKEQQLKQMSHKHRVQLGLHFN